MIQSQRTMTAAERFSVYDTEKGTPKHTKLQNWITDNVKTIAPSIFESRDWSAGEKNEFDEQVRLCGVHNPLDKIPKRPDAELVGIPKQETCLVKGTDIYQVDVRATVSTPRLTFKKRAISIRKKLADATKLIKIEPAKSLLQQRFCSLNGERVSIHDAIEKGSYNIPWEILNDAIAQARCRIATFVCSPHVEMVQTFVYFEAKVRINDTGYLFSQVNRHIVCMQHPLWFPYYVVSPDDRHADRIRGQEFAFVKAPELIT